MLMINNLKAGYGNKQVLHGISGQFESGLIHGIIGLNGAGKTTFFKCVCGLMEYDGTVNDTEISDLKNNIGYVPTEPYFFPRLKGSEYLAFLQHARNGKHTTEHAFDLPLNDYIESYSTGMKRKLAFMGAMQGDSALYIFDEPFNGVDIKSNLILKHKILALKAAGKTVLLSSHIISSLTELCDEIHLLKDGLISRHYRSDEYNKIEAELISAT